MLHILLHVPLVDHLAQELRRDLALVGFVLQQADAAAELLQLFEVGRDRCLPGNLLLLVLFDLRLGSAFLAVGLHHVRADALANCEEKESDQE